MKSSYEAACEEGQKKLLFFIQFQTFVFTSTSSLFSLLLLSLPFFLFPLKLGTLSLSFCFSFDFFYSPFHFHFFIVSSPNQDLDYFLTCSPSALWFLSSPPFPSPFSLSSKLSRSIQSLKYQTNVRRCRFEVYKPSSLLRPYIADTSALPT